MSFPFISKTKSPIIGRIKADDSTRLRLKYDTYYHIFDKQRAPMYGKMAKSILCSPKMIILG